MSQNPKNDKRAELDKLVGEIMDTQTGVFAKLGNKPSVEDLYQAMCDDYDALAEKLAEARHQLDNCTRGQEMATDDYKMLREENQRLREALQFYAVIWRSDVYPGPTEELIKDFGAIAREALKNSEDGE